MTIQEFKSKAKVSDFNTLNTWGFGGSVGSSYKLGDFYMEIKRVGTRHNGTYKIENYRNDKISPYILYTKKEFIEAIKKL